jgi:hypothetical protein
MNGKCNYCERMGPNRLGEDDPTYVCSGCWNMLQNPVTALPFIRGHLTLELRGKVPDDQLKVRINRFMEGISKWKRSNAN